MNETQIESNSLVKYFTDDISGLGYKEVSKSLVSKSLFIKSDIMDFLKSPLNIKNFNQVLKDDFANDENKFYQEYISKIEEELSSLATLNVATFLNKEMIFNGKSFFVFYKPNLSNPKKSQAHHNIHSIVSQYTHCYKDENDENINGFTFRPDLVFFVNGIYIGYLELKFNSNGQSAEDEGVSQIIDKYKSSYEIYEQEVLKLDTSAINSKSKITNQKKRFKKSFLKIFHSPIHLVAFDSHSLYMIRNIDPIENIINKPETDLAYGLSEFYNQARKEFKEYPNEAKDWKKLIWSIYSKEMIEREISYYNFSERSRTLDKNGQHRNKNEDSILISPRPKQKYGTDKAIGLVQEMIDNEGTPDYWDRKILEQIKDLPDDIKSKIIEERSKYKNGKYVYSILLAYSAGFGKTNIIGWIALLLKDMIGPDQNYAFDTIFLITDRLELKTQIEGKMAQMNVNKGMIEEVKNKKSFELALKNNKKIIIVNIQKFQTIKESLSDNLLDKLQYQRNAFIVDEIHRSNSGSQHEDMMEMFTDVLSTETDNTTRKKNLVIGLTATAKEETLLRFGEYSGCVGGNAVFRPHDEFTMQESIDAGYTLDFSKHITPYAVQMDYYKDEAVGDGSEMFKESLSKKKIYENDKRIEAISEIVTTGCLNNIFGQIRGSGKAMLACYSIQAAVKYHKYISEKMKDKTSNGVFEKYSKAPIHVLFSSNSNDKTIPSINKLNDGKNEKQIIDSFKNNKNGIIIVVDKLQTGFDEPKLHTLFLDKEITGVGAVQALSRVNRTTKNKSSCHIVDFSHGNINFNKNIPEALSVFRGQLYSKSNTSTPLADLQVAHGILKKHFLRKNFKKSFITTWDSGDTDGIIKIENSVINWCEGNKSLLSDLLLNIGSYLHGINTLHNIIDISDYLDANMELFFKRVANIIKTNFGNSDDIDTHEIFVDFVDIGKVVFPDKEDDGGGNGMPPGNGRKRKATKSNSSLIDKLLETERIKETSIKQYKEYLDILCRGIVVLGDLNQCDDIKGKILDGGFDEEYLEGLFIKLAKKVRRRNKADLPESFINSVIDFKPNAYEDFRAYVLV